MRLITEVLDLIGPGMSGDDIQSYCNETDLGLSKLVTPNVALTCNSL